MMVVGMLIGISNVLIPRARQSEMSKMRAPINEESKHQAKLTRLRASRAAWGAISPANAINPVWLIIEATIKAEKPRTIVRISFKRTPSVLLSSSSSPSNTICLRIRIKPRNPIRKNGTVAASFDAVMLPRLPIAQYSIEASSLSGSA